MTNKNYVFFEIFKRFFCFLSIALHRHWYEVGA